MCTLALYESIGSISNFSLLLAFFSALFMDGDSKEVKRRVGSLDHCNVAAAAILTVMYGG